MSNVVEGDCSKADSHLSTHRDDPQTEFLPLKDYVERNLIPGFATIKKTRNCKCHNSNNYLLTGLEEEIYIHSVSDVTNAVSEEMTLRPGKGIVSTRRKFLIPIDYNGWFEVLSQDGLSRRPIHSVAELTHLIPSTGCLVREPVTGYRKNADGHCRVQKIRAGEILQPRETTDSIPGLKDKRFLICTDQKRNEIFLSVEEKGLFSPVACRSCIAGAHSIRSLLEKFRLPLMVRLLHGNIVQDDGRQRNGACDQMFKLVGIHKEEVVFVLPVGTLTKTLEDDLQILSIPIRTKHLVAKSVSKEKFNVQNQNEKLDDLKQLCQSLVLKLSSTIQPSISQSDYWQIDDVHLNLNPLEKTSVNLAVVQSEEGKLQQSVKEEERLFREIEDLYGWVRNPRNRLSGIPMHVQYTKANQDFPKTFNTAAFRNYSSARKEQMRPFFDGSNWKLLQQQQNLGFDKRGIGQEREGRLTNQQTMASKAYRKTGILGDNRKYESKMRCLEPRSNSTERHVYEEIPINDPASNSWTRTLPPTNLTTVPVPEVTTVGKDRKVVKTPAAIQHNTTSTARSPIQRGELLDHKTLMNTQHPMPIAKLYEQNNAFQRDSNDHRSFRPEASNYRRPLIRPMSYAGTAVADQRLSELLGRPALPPSLPPKRGVSLSNLNTLTELQISHGDRMNPSSPKSSGKTLAISDPKQVEDFTPNKTNRFSDNIIGSVSRSLVKTFRRIGNKTSAVFAANSSPTAEDVDRIYLASYKNDPAVIPQQPNISAESPKRLSIHPTMDDNILTTY